MFNKLIIVISGQIVRENSANLNNFWQGFINIQYSLSNVDDLKIVAHSWNPEYDELVKNVYNLDELNSEKQENFFVEYIENIEKLDIFEKNFDRSSSKWKNVSYQSILGNAKSRSRAVSLLDNYKNDDFEDVLVTRWDQGCTGSRDVNTIIYDSSLSNKYLYLSYFEGIDEGYPDMWMIGNIEDIILFKEYDKYILTSLSNKNDYIDNFTKNGWPLSIKKRNKKNYTKNFIVNLIDKFKLNKLPLLGKKIKNYQSKLEVLIKKPIITGENYLTSNSKSNIRFPMHVAMNNHAILKSFIINNKLRSRVRFLKTNDFKNNNYGQLINPKKFAHAIYSHSSYSDCWDMVLGQSLECLPSNCKQIYLISDESKITKKAFTTLQKKYPSIKLITYNNDFKYTKRLFTSLSKINEKYDYLYFIHEDMPLVEQVDGVYLNALLHYLTNSNEFYIKLVDTTTVNKKEKNVSFPGLSKNFGECSMSVQASIFKIDYLQSLFKNLDLGLYEFELLMTRSNLIFSAVEGDFKIGKSVLANSKFPHITTAIAKGKWCTSEWGNEIKYLANKYDIDLSIRGER